jgi:solute carrier family 31 (copper transporter), member 1
MLWNWDTIDACFLTRSWRVRSSAGFAGTCIVVALLVLALEALRRVSREYDGDLARRPRPRRPASRAGPPPPPAGAAGAALSAAGRALSAAAAGAPRAFRDDPAAAAVRALRHTCQFAVAYLVMLLAMYYNGYVLISIFVGAFLGSFLFGRGPAAQGDGREAGEATCCCG